MTSRKRHDFCCTYNSPDCGQHNRREQNCHCDGFFAASRNFAEFGVFHDGRIGEAVCGGMPRLRMGDGPLVHVGTASIAAGLAGATVFVSLSAWMMQGGALANGAASAGVEAAATTNFTAFEERFSSGRFALSSRSAALRTTIAAQALTIAADTDPEDDAALSVANSSVPDASVATPPIRLASLEPMRVTTQSVLAPPVPKASPPRGPAPSNPLADDTAHTAIYDISAHTVYLPNGERLEAHSGLGEHIDDVRAVNLKMRGPTPPNVYELKLREGSFHGVQAVRLNPVRLRPNVRPRRHFGASVHARPQRPVERLRVIQGLSRVPERLSSAGRSRGSSWSSNSAIRRPAKTATASDWFSNALKGVFGRS